MVVIRLARAGSKKNPFYHIVATDKRNRRDGRFIERIGHFNPLARGQATRYQLQQDRIDYWISKGARPSERVAHIIKEFAKLAAAETQPEAASTKAQLRQQQAAASAEIAKKKVAEAKAAAEAEKSEAPAKEEASTADEKAEASE